MSLKLGAFIHYITLCSQRISNSEKGGAESYWYDADSYTCLLNWRTWALMLILRNLWLLARLETIWPYKRVAEVCESGSQILLGTFFFSAHPPPQIGTHGDGWPQKGIAGFPVFGHCVRPALCFKSRAPWQAFSLLPPTCGVHACCFTSGPFSRAPADSRGWVGMYYF